MSDWDTVTKIGSKVSGGGSQRETVVRGKGALNQAQRSGAIVGTEKKYATGNAVSPLPLHHHCPNLQSPQDTPICPAAMTDRRLSLLPPKQAKQAGTEGQRLTKVDRSDDIVAPQKIPSEVGANIRSRRSKEGPYKMTQAQLAQKVNAQANDIKLLESGDGIKNQGLLNRVCRVLKISSKTGLPLDDK